MHRILIIFVFFILGTTASYADQVLLDDYTAWHLGMITKHQKCYRYYRNEIKKFAYGTKRLSGDDLMILADEMADHKRTSFAFFKDLEGPNSLFLGNMATQYDASDYAPYRKKYPQLTEYFNWIPDLEKCLGIK